MTTPIFHLGIAMRGYVLRAVVYIPYDGDPYRDKRAVEARRAEELFNMLKTVCREYEVSRSGLFGVEAVFRRCAVELYPEKGDIYELEPL